MEPVSVHILIIERPRSAFVVPMQSVYIAVAEMAMYLYMIIQNHTTLNANIFYL